MFNEWLTGLIEGDGSIVIPSAGMKKNIPGRPLSETKKRYPFIRIAFHKKDLPLAKYIKKTLGYGTIVSLKSNTVLWTVYEELALIDLIQRLNGNMRTPKYLRLHELIKFKNLEIECLGPDFSNFGNNSWLAGMSDADSNFNITLTKLKKNNFRIQTQWRLEFAQKTYHGYDQLYWASLLSNFLETTLYSRTRQKEEKMYSSFMVIAFNNNSKDIITNYFQTYPLLSSKYLDYKDWTYIRKLEKTHKKDKELLDMVSKIKNSFNNKRINFNWEHLNNKPYKSC